MAYSGYGAFVFCNGHRRRDKEDVALFAPDEEVFGCDSSEVGSGARIYLSLLKAHEDGTEGDENAWIIRHIHHGIMGDGPVRVMCHKQGLPRVFEMTESGPEEIEVNEEDPYDYSTVDFEYKGYRFRFESGHPYRASMIEPDGTKWLCKYDYEYGAGWMEDDSVVDVIERKELESFFSKILEECAVVSERFKDTRETFMTVMQLSELSREIPPANAIAMRWISAEEQLPDLPDQDYCHTSVIAYAKNWRKAVPMDYARTINRKTGKREERWMWNDRIFREEVTHWMPYPGGPKRSERP